MFLHKFEHMASKVLFLEYACLLAMADGSSDTDEVGVNENNSTQSYFNYIDINELNSLKKYAEELDLGLLTKSDSFGTTCTVHQSFLKASLTKDCGKYYFFNNEAISGLIEDQCFYSLSDNQKYKFFPALGSVLKLSQQGKIEKYSDDKSIKQRVINELISSGVDLMEINPENIHRVMISFDDIKGEILKNSTAILSSTKNAYLDEMTNKDKKLVLFELISFCSNNGKISNNQMDLIQQMCTCLRVDSAYIEEFMEVIQRIFAVNKEAKELINE